MLENQKANHQAYGLRPAACHIAEKRGKRIFEHLPVDQIGNDIQLMVDVQHAFQIPEKGWALDKGFALIHTRNLPDL